MKTETNVKAEIVSVNHAETSLGSLKLRTYLEGGCPPKARRPTTTKRSRNT